MGIRFASRSRIGSALRKSKRWVSPRGETNNGEYAHLFSGNILYDPGVELFVGNAVESYSIHDWNDRTGEDHYTLPNYDDSCDTRQRWPNGDCVSYYDIAQWVTLGGYDISGDLDDKGWHVTRLSPYLGDYAMAWWRWSKGDGGNPNTLLVQSPGLPGGYSARVDGADRVTFSVRALMYDYDTPILTGSAGSPTISPMLYYYTKTGTPIVGGGNYYQALTTTYAEYLYDTSAPSGSYFVRAMVAFTAGTPSAYTLGHDPSVLVDSGVLSIE